ncbi:hypothetical protein DFJ73DRAFT_760391 [Zopfochytrium polystomum]|nr:hypothetical protein DFJ73DRAFT_760391 [Zopfochytrium polystomum]
MDPDSPCTNSKLHITDKETAAFRRERILERFNSRISQSTTSNGQQVEVGNPNPEGHGKVFGRYFEHPPSDRVGASLHRSAGKRDRRGKRRWVCLANAVVWSERDEREVTAVSGEDSDVGDDVVASEAVVEIIAGNQIDHEAGLGAGGANDSSTVQSGSGAAARSEGCNPGSPDAIITSPVLLRQRARRVDDRSVRAIAGRHRWRTSWRGLSKTSESACVIAL